MKFEISNNNKNMAMSSSILCLADRVFDVMNKAGMCDRSVCYVMRQSFSALRSLVRNKLSLLHPRQLRFEVKETGTSVE